MWFFTRPGKATKASKNREAGADVLEMVNINGSTWTEVMSKQVYPAIRMRFPKDVKKIEVVLDNAK